MAINVYKHSDPGAPPHPSNERGSMAALLRACLVTGYSLGDDSKPSAGWEEPFEELNNFAVFRSLVGARQFYQLDDNMPDADVAYMNACESLSAVDATPAGQWGENYFGKQYSLSYNTEWTVIADERTCYVVLHSYGGNIIHGFGEFASLVPNDPYNSFLVGHSSSSYLPQTSSYSTVPMVCGGSIGTNGQFEVHRTCIGTFAGNGSLVRGVGNSSYPGGSLCLDNVSNANVGLGYYTQPMFITCDRNQENGNYFIRGKLRGIFFPLAYLPVDHMEEFVDSVTGQTMLSVHWGIYNSASYYGSVHFQISGGW